MWSDQWTPDGKYYVDFDSANADFVGYTVSRSGLDEIWRTDMGDNPWVTNMMYPCHAYGNMYIPIFDGFTCLEPATGKVLWRHDAGETSETPFNTWAPCYDPSVADGKVYFTTSEHSPTQPYPRGNKQYCVDAFTGETIWAISSQGNYYSVEESIAEGYLISGDEYLGKIFCYGKGKTETTVSASPKVVAKGSKILIEGTVMDMSPAQPGTPAISDEDMTAWMHYMQKGKLEPVTNVQDNQWGTPVDVKGVPVNLAAVDPNGNYHEIGTVTSDSSGLFSTMWTPPVSGKYTVFAYFDGSKSYWPSHAETAFGVEEVSVLGPIEPEPTEPEAPLITTEVAIIAAVAVASVIGVAAYWILRKRQ
jgi:hypothetical protein